VAARYPWRVKLYGLCVEDCPDNDVHDCIANAASCQVTNYGSPARHAISNRPLLVSWALAALLASPLPCLAQASLPAQTEILQSGGDASYFMTMKCPEKLSNPSTSPARREPAGYCAPLAQPADQGTGSSHRW
jgi:hypothetical protein